MNDTWFEVIEATPPPAPRVPREKPSYYVMRLDRTSLPQGTIVASPYLVKSEADAAAAQMRETGTS